MSTARPVEQSLFPDVAPDRPRGALLGSVVAGTNADLVAAIAPIYLEGHSVMDVTYGRGGWWKRYLPPSLIAHDLAHDGVDFRSLPELDGSVDVVCFDPPYIRAGGPATTARAADFRDRFGIGQPRSLVELDDLISDGLAEAARVARLWVLVKCSDFTDSNTLTFGHLKIITWSRNIGLGDPWDLIIHHTGAGPGGHNIFTPRRARRHHSYLLVFQVPS